MADRAIQLDGDIPVAPVKAKKKPAKRKQVVDVHIDHDFFFSHIGASGAEYNVQTVQKMIASWLKKEHKYK